MGKGGYSVGMFERVNPGDVFLCYCKGPAMRWVGALRVKGEAFQSDEPVWGFTETGEARFPWRFHVEPIVTLDPASAIPGPEVASQLEFLKRLKQWGTYLQRSLNRVPDEDGDRLLAMLSEPRDPVPLDLPHRRASKRKAEAPEPTLLDAQAVPLEVAPTETAAEESPAEEPRTHTEIQAKLRDTGFFEGYDVWVADRGTFGTTSRSEKDACAICRSSPQNRRAG